MMSTEQVTIKDLASRLNVSPSTVSRALHDSPEISKATRKAIHQLAKELNYQPNSVAMSLRQKQTFTIGVIVPEIVHYFFSSVISGIEDAAYENNFQVILCQSNERYVQEIMNIKTLAQSQVDGILISYSKETKDFEHIKRIVDKGIPVVFYDRSPESLVVDSVIVDDFGGAYQAVDHLIKSGCKRIAHFYGPHHLEINLERTKGFKSAMLDHGLNIDHDLVIEADSFKTGYKKVQKLIEDGKKIDGLFTVTDLTAVGAIKGIKTRGLKVPGDIAVVGFGDDSTLSQMVDPTLSSVIQPGFDMGTKATKLLLDRINGKEQGEPRLIKLSTKLHVRESSARKIN